MEVHLLENRKHIAVLFDGDDEPEFYTLAEFAEVFGQDFLSFILGKNS